MEYDYPVMQLEEVLGGESLFKDLNALLKDQEKIIDSFVTWVTLPDDHNEVLLETAIAKSTETFRGLLIAVTEKPLGFSQFGIEDRARQTQAICAAVRETRQQLLKDKFPDDPIFFAEEFDGYDDEKSKLEDEDNLLRIFKMGRAVIVTAELLPLYRPDIIADLKGVQRVIGSEAQLPFEAPLEVTDSTYDFNTLNKIKSLLENDHKIPKEAMVAAAAIAAWSAGHFAIKAMHSRFKRRSAKET